MFPMKIEPGEVRISTIMTIMDLDDVKIVELDLSTKYVEVMAYVRGDNEYKIFLLGRDCAMHLDESRRGEATVLAFELPDEDSAGWESIADGGRYTIRVALYRNKEVYSTHDVVLAETITVTE